MGWEIRGNNRYYYRKRWIDRRVVSEYIGAGELAEALAMLDEYDQQERVRLAAEWRTVVDDDRQQAETMAELEDLVRLAMTAVLIANGYHTHKRQWRRRADVQKRLLTDILPE